MKKKKILLQKVIKIKTLNSVFKKLFFFKDMAYLIKRDVRVGRKNSCSYIIYPIEDQVCSTYTNRHHFFIKKNSQVCLFHRTAMNRIQCQKRKWFLFYKK